RPRRRRARGRGPRAAGGARRARPPTRRRRRRTGIAGETSSSGGAALRPGGMAARPVMPGGLPGERRDSEKSLLRFRELLEGALQEGLAVDVLEGFEDLELAVLEDLADVDVLREVVVLLRRDGAAGAVEGDAAFE